MITILDAVAGLLTLIVSRFLQPEDAKFILQIWALIQPVIVAWVLAIAWEDSAALKANTHPFQIELMEVYRGENEGE